MQEFSTELEWLQASYNPGEMEHFVSNNSSILKFTIDPETYVTFEIPESYPGEAARISISSSKITNSEKCIIEKDIRNYASQLLENYVSVITIDHMRQKRKYSKTLHSWAQELNICGLLLFCQKWIFLILEGLKNDIKEFIVRHKTTPVDVDSSGKPCKEKMSKVIFEGQNNKVFTSFTIEEFANINMMENYFTDRNLCEILKIVESCYKVK